MLSGWAVVFPLGAGHAAHSGTDILKLLDSPLLPHHPNRAVSGLRGVHAIARPHCGLAALPRCAPRLPAARDPPHTPSVCPTKPHSVKLCGWI